MDEDDKLLAQIDRNWRGIGFEVISFSVYTYQSIDISYTFIFDACSHSLLVSCTDCMFDSKQFFSCEIYVNILNSDN